LSLEPPTSAPASPAMALDRAMGIWGLWLVREGVSGIFVSARGNFTPTRRPHKAGCRKDHQ
jgi:hypothetical protein